MEHPEGGSSRTEVAERDREWRRRRRRQQAGFGAGAGAGGAQGGLGFAAPAQAPLYFCFSSCCWKTEGLSWLDARGLRRCLVGRWFYFRPPAWPWQALSRRLPVVPF